MSGMKEYSFTPLDGTPTTVLLSDEDAKERGLKLTVPAAAPKAKQPANKQAAPLNKSGSTVHKVDD